MTDDASKLRDWDSLEPEEQTSIRVEYSYYLDTQPPCCSLGSKIARFRYWLETEKGIQYK